MTASVITSAKRSDNLGLHSLASVLTVLLLMLIDNGISMFTQLARPGVWIGILIYSVIILFGQAVVRELFLLRYKGQHKTKLSLLIGIPLGIFFLYSVFYILKNQY